MYSLSYLRPLSLADALQMLADEPMARPLSGGMTLIPTLKQRLSAPSHVVDLSRLPELRGISEQGGMLRIGAAMKHAEVASSELVRARCPALAKLAGLIADPQVRNRGTMGGSVANNDPAADYPSAVLGLNATVITNRRRIAADDFFAGLFSTVLEEGELIVAFEYPFLQQANYEKRRHAASGYAVVGIFIARHTDHVRVAVTGAGESVFRWREAESALEGDFSLSALQDADLDVSMLPDDPNASSAYRANLIRVYARRALQGLLDRTTQGA